jgi:topoisomerase-4 subunit B
VSWKDGQVNEEGLRTKAKTHDWSVLVDHEHIRHIRRDPAGFAPGGTAHLILEVLGYASEEAEATGGGSCSITLHADGSVAVSDRGRGTDTVVDVEGNAAKKPLMSTRDLRYFSASSPPPLADGQPRRGMSVVAALSEWLVHTNRRTNGSWTQRYENAVPVTDLIPTTDDATTGTTVHFLPMDVVRTAGRIEAAELVRWTSGLPHLTVTVEDLR